MTNLNEVMLRDALLRKDFRCFLKKCFYTVNPGTPYLHNWHIDLIARYLRECEHGKIHRFIVNIPPRYLKSLIISVAWPAWLLGHDPTRRIIVASYADSLSHKHSLDCRLVMQSDWYQRIFPETCIASGQNEKHKFVTTARGFRLAVSVGGSVTGEGGNFLIVDDPMNPTLVHSLPYRERVQRWYDQTFSSRLDDKKRGVIVIVMQRLHEDDLTGHLLGKHSEWRRLRLPVVEVEHTRYRHEGELLHPAREGQKEVERMKQELGSFAFAAQYQQAPVANDAGMIQRSWLHHYTDNPPETLRITQSWDTAIKAGNQHDYSVCMTWGESEAYYYLLDNVRDKLEYPALKKLILAQAEHWQPHAILLEDKASGQSLLQDLRKTSSLPLIGITPTKDKLTRMAAVSPLFEAGKVLLPRRASWLIDYEAELLAFPHGSHDDQVDATSQYLGWVQRKGNKNMQIRKI